MHLTARSKTAYFAVVIAIIVSDISLADTITNKAIIRTYADIATSSYKQALNDVKNLQVSIQTFDNEPNAANLAAAKSAWLKARESYGVTEIFRLSGGPIDAEEGWVAHAYGAREKQINSWPLDEKMIDYTMAADGSFTSGNIIDTKGIFNPGSGPVDITSITAESLASLNENGGTANITTGYHAIEFLLWGQDQDYSNFISDRITNGALVAGQRPLQDFNSGTLAHRRLAYLKAVTKLLVADLNVVYKAWDDSVSTNGCDTDMTGCYRSALLGKLTATHANKNLSADDALRQIITGMGVFIKSELANERIAVAILTPSEEDEQSCFSDNTHRDITTNYQGFVNVLKGEINGVYVGTSMYDSISKATRLKLNVLMNDINKRVVAMNKLAETTMHFDYQIADSMQVAEIRRMKNDMRTLGDAMTTVASDLAISLIPDDVTDAE